MKNTLLKVWGIVLTLAILSGLLMATVPMSAAATPNTWTLGSNPIPSMGNQTNIYTIAGDGTTMFLWTPTATATAQKADNTTTTLYVSSTDGFPATGSVTVAGTDATNSANSVNVTVNYSAISTNTFTITAGFLPSTGVVAGAKVTSANASDLYKSLDAGMTWSSSGLTTPAPVVTMLKINPNDSTQLVAVDNANNLYRSITGGRVWTPATPVGTILSGATTIYSVDITTDSNGTTILVGTNAGVSMLNGALGSWAAVGAATWGVTILPESHQAIAVAFAPGYINSQEILAVSLDNNTSTRLRVIIPPAATTSNGWGMGLIDSPLQIGSGATAIATGPITGADIAFPADFSGTNLVFVSLNNGATASSAIDVYRVTLQNFGATPVVKATGLGQNVYSLAVVGNTSGSTVSAGLVSGGVWKSTDAATAASPTWAAVAKGPIGTNVNVTNVNTSIYAGSMTSGASYCAFFLSTDMNLYNGISFFETPNVYTTGVLNFGASVWMTNGPTFNRLLMKNAAGAWTIVLDNGSNGWGVPSGAPGSKTMYFSQTGTSTLLMKTTDGGQTWATVGTGFKQVTCLTVVDDNTYWIGYNGYIQRNDGVPLPISTVAENPTSITLVGATGILVKTGVGPVLSTWLYSGDSGATFTVLGTVDQYINRPTSYVAAEKNVYVVDSTNNIYTWTLGTSTSWTLTTIGPITMPTAGETVGAIGVVGGVYYIIVKTGTNNNDAQVWRSTTPYYSEFRAVTGSSKALLLGAFGFSFGAPNSDGSQTINGSITYDSTIAPYPAGLAASIPVSFTDTVVAPITLTSPVDQIFINNPVTFTWKAATATPPVTYRLEVAYDAIMSLPVANFPQFVTNTTYFAPILNTGTTYYWRVRVESAFPGVATAGVYTGVTSKLSDVHQFTVKTSGSSSDSIDVATSVYPSRGQVNVNTSPVLTWGTVSGATYNIQIATDSGFNTVVDSKNGLTVAVYTPAAALKPNTTYYWEVQAVSNGIASDWVAFAFTTAPVAVVTTSGSGSTTVTLPAPTVIVTMPTQPQQSQPNIIVTVNPGTGTSNNSTPAWAWIVIAIGAVLVIAVIVLIVRTRRV